MQNSRFAVAIHTLVLLAAKAGKPTSSDYIAGSVGTNPVLIRRLMGDLRAAGIVDSRAGATGGFVLAQPVERIGLDEIYRAVEDAPLFARHENANPNCPIGRAVGVAAGPRAGPGGERNGAEPQAHDARRPAAVTGSGHAAGWIAKQLGFREREERDATGILGGHPGGDRHRRAGADRTAGPWVRRRKQPSVDRRDDDDRGHLLQPEPGADPHLLARSSGPSDLRLRNPSG